MKDSKLKINSKQSKEGYTERLEKTFLTDLMFNFNNETTVLTVPRKYDKQLKKSIKKIT